MVISFFIFIISFLLWSTVNCISYILSITITQCFNDKAVCHILRSSFFFFYSTACCLPLQDSFFVSVAIGATKEECTTNKHALDRL